MLEFLPKHVPDWDDRERIVAILKRGFTSRDVRAQRAQRLQHYDKVTRQKQERSIELSISDFMERLNRSELNWALKYTDKQSYWCYLLWLNRTRYPEYYIPNLEDKVGGQSSQAVLEIKADRRLLLC